MTQVTRFAWPIPVMGDDLGFSNNDDPDAEVVEPIDWAIGSNAAVQVAVSITESGDIAEGETVIGTGPTNLANSNDRDYSTKSMRAAGVEGGGGTNWYWEIDFGAGVEVTSMAVDSPVLPVGSGDAWQPSFTVTLEHSATGLGGSFSSATYTYSTSTVPTGLSFPDPSTTTRHTYTLDTPTTDRFWKIVQTVGSGFHVASGMAEWWVFGSASTGVQWQAAPAANDGDDSTYALSDATFAGGEWLQVDLGAPKVIFRAELRVGHTSSGSKTLDLYGSDDANFTTPVLLDSVTFAATGSFTADDVTFAWVPTASYQFYRIESSDTDRRVYDINMFSAAVGGVVVEHEQLVGRDDADQHPATAVTVTDSAGWFTGTTVETAMAELAAKAIGYQAHGNTGTTETFDAATGWHSATLNANCTFTLTAAASGTVSSLFLELTQDGTGGRTITLPASVVNKTELEAAQVTTLSTTSFLVLLSRDGGTTWYGGWWGSSGGSSLTVKDEGVALSTAATTLDFVGASVTATGTGATKTITVSATTPTAADISALGFVGPILISDTPSNPLVFDDLLQNDDGDDLLYADL